MATKEELEKLYDEVGVGKGVFKFDDIPYNLYKTVSGDFYGISTPSMLVTILKEEDLENIEIIKDSEYDLLKQYKALAKKLEVVEELCKNSNTELAKKILEVTKSA